MTVKTTAEKSKRPKSATERILADLDARSARDPGGNWAGFVFSHRGERILKCLHSHVGPNSAKACAAKLAKRWAALEAARGVKP